MTEPVRSHVTGGQVVLPSLLDSITYVVGWSQHGDRT